MLTEEIIQNGALIIGALMVIMVVVNLIINIVLSHRIKKTYRKIEAIENSVKMYIDEVTKEEENEIKNEEIIMKNIVAEEQNSLISSVLEEIFP